jgi:putative ABC transport system permease protein
LHDEISAHVEMQEADDRAAGARRESAYTSARRTVGNATLIREDARFAWGFTFLESILQDIRHAARLLRKNPGFTAVAILTLALGIGANTAIFSIVDTVILKPLPYKDSSRMVYVQTSTAMFPGFNLGVSWLALQRFRSDAPAIEQSAATDSQEMNFSTAGHPDRVSVVGVTGDFFDEFGITPQLGGLFVSQDQQAEQSHLAVLSDKFWRTRLGSSPNVVGQKILLDKQPYTVVGVAAPKFEYPSDTSVWTPLFVPLTERTNPTSFYYQIVSKLRPGATLPQAQAQLKTIADRIAKDNPVLQKGYELVATPMLERSVGNIRQAYLILLAASTFVLLIACANLASLLLGRGWYRQREMALRAALGASRSRLARQMLVESCLLGVLGGIVGAALAAAGVKLFIAIAPADTRRLGEITLNSTLLWFSLATSLGAGILFGLAPARRAAKFDPNRSLKDAPAGALAGTSSTRQPKLTGALVVVEIALAFVLLFGAALTAQSLSRLLNVNTGIRTDHILTFELPQPPAGINSSEAQMKSLTAKQDEQLALLIARLRAVPGVEDVAITSYSVLSGTVSLFSADLRLEGQARPNAPIMTSLRLVSPSFFHTLGIAISRGRAFTDQDANGSHQVAIVNEAFAKKFLGSLDVVGKNIISGTDSATTKSQGTEIVGVVADTRDSNLGTDPKPEYYSPVLQNYLETQQILIHTTGDPMALTNSVSQAVWSLEPEQPVTHIVELSREVARTVGEPRMHVILLEIFAGIGLALALLGVYGVLAYSVARRTREIGIRMALGANRGTVLRMIVQQGLVLAVAGTAIGIAAALALNKAIASELFGVKPTDPATFVAVTFLMLVVACLACGVPAWRAMRTDPTIALRHE